MQYLIAIPLITGLVSLAISFWAAPRIKKDLDQQGLSNTLIDILSWRPHSRAYHSEQPGGDLELDWIHPSKFELHDNKELMVLFQKIDYIETVTKGVSENLKVKEKVKQLDYDTLNLWYQRNTDMSGNKKGRNPIINYEEKSDNSILLWVYPSKRNTFKTPSSVLSQA